MKTVKELQGVLASYTARVKEPFSQVPKENHSIFKGLNDKEKEVMQKLIKRDGVKREMDNIEKASQALPAYLSKSLKETTDRLKDELRSLEDGLGLSDKDLSLLYNDDSYKKRNSKDFIIASELSFDDFKDFHDDKELLGAFLEKKDTPTEFLLMNIDNAEDGWDLEKIGSHDNFPEELMLDFKGSEFQKKWLLSAMSGKAKRPDILKQVADNVRDVYDAIDLMDNPNLTNEALEVFCKRDLYEITQNSDWEKKEELKDKILAKIENNQDLLKSFCSSNGTDNKMFIKISDPDFIEEQVEKEIERNGYYSKLSEMAKNPNMKNTTLSKIIQSKKYGNACEISVNHPNLDEETQTQLIKEGYGSSVSQRKSISNSNIDNILSNEKYLNDADIIGNLSETKNGLLHKEVRKQAIARGRGAKLAYRDDLTKNERSDIIRKSFSHYSYLSTYGVGISKNNLLKSDEVKDYYERIQKERSDIPKGGKGYKREFVSSLKNIAQNLEKHPNFSKEWKKEFSNTIKKK